MRWALALLAFAMATPCIASAQGRVPSALASTTTAVNAIDTVRVARQLAAIAEGRPPRDTPARSRNVRRGLIIGASTGLIAGAIVGSQLGTGCEVTETEHCSSRSKHVELTLGVAAEGAILGGATGGLIGLVWPSKKE